MKQYNQKPFSAKEIDSNKTGWVVDLSAENTVNPDCYFYFATKKQGNNFIKLLDEGHDIRTALHIICDFYGVK